MKKELTGPEIVETLLKTGTKEWNESISSRLESLRSFMMTDEWQKGVSPYLRAAQGHAIIKLLGESLPQDANNYLRGLIAGLQLVVSLPATIEAEIQRQSKKPDSGPKGNAGY